MPAQSSGAILGNKDQQKMLQKRARSKYFSMHLAQELAALNSNLKKSYERTYNCGSQITQTGNKLTSTYCGARWCVMCNRIRTAKLINKYTPHLNEMHQPCFITLTIPNITGTAADLRAEVDRMQIFLRKASDNLRKYGIKFKGFRKIEISYNYKKNNYHPHIHILSDGTIDVSEWCDKKSIQKIWKLWKMKGFSRSRFSELIKRYNTGKITAGCFKGELLLQMWLENFPDARSVAQDVRPATPGTLKELFKYSTKVLTKSKSLNKYTYTSREYVTRSGEVREVLKKSLAPAEVYCFVSSLDKIYRALKNKRVLQPTGYCKEELQQFNEIASGAVQDDLQAQEFNDLQQGATAYVWCGYDWREIITGAFLSGFIPDRSDQSRITSFVFDSG